ncbi:MAG: hypothetical protein AAB489_00400 [Patescibacteria group bacterium]
MKRFLLLAGLLLFLRVESASAAPVSPYTENVLERADAGILYAWTAPAVPGITLIFGHWTKSIGSTLLALIDTKQRITLQQRDLAENTACLHIDLYYIEAKMKKVQDDLNRALTLKNITAIIRLQDLMAFLNERLEILFYGGKDPLIEDRDWYEVRAFDPPKNAWCCGGTPRVDLCREDAKETCMQNGEQIFRTQSECTAYGCLPAAAGGAMEAPICPFHTDYLPPSDASGYGCDQELLNAVVSGLPSPLKETVDAERKAMQSGASVLDAYIAQAQALATLDREIRSLLGRPVVNIPPVPVNAPHRAVSGCPTGWPWGTDSNGDIWPDGAIAWELRSPFTIQRDEQKLLNAFQELRMKEGDVRPMSGNFDLRGEPGRNTIYRALNQYAADWFSNYSVKQGVWESEIFPLGGDTHLSVSVAASKLKESVGKLSSLARDRGGLRSFVRNFAYYLRRTCIARPCSTRLDQILRIVLEDSCFPYTNGEYLKGVTYEQCKKDAGLSNVNP